VNASGGKNTKSTFSQVAWKSAQSGFPVILSACTKKIMYPFIARRSRNTETPKKEIQNRWRPLVQH